MWYQGSSFMLQPNVDHSNDCRRLLPAAAADDHWVVGGSVGTFNEVIKSDSSVWKNLLVYWVAVLPDWSVYMSIADILTLTGYRFCVKYNVTYCKCMSRHKALLNLLDHFEVMLWFSLSPDAFFSVLSVFCAGICRLADQEDFILDVIFLQDYHYWK